MNQEAGIIQKFEAGKTYATRSACDYNCIVAITVAKRTAKTIVTTEGKRFRPGVSNGIEYVLPWGNFSMCPFLSADEVAA